MEWHARGRGFCAWCNLGKGNLHGKQIQSVPPVQDCQMEQGHAVKFEFRE